MDLPSKVVIVEDELMSQRHITKILENLGVEVVGCFDNASDARAAVTKDSCDMILMDINIKGAEDGIQLSRSLLQQYNIPIVFISAYSDNETLEEVMDLSPYGFVTKPFSSKDIEVAMGIAYRRFYADKRNKPIEKSPSAQQQTINMVEISPQIHFDLLTHSIYYNDNLVRLNKKQLKLIEVLVLNLNQIVSYDTIMDKVWPEGILADSSLRTLVYSLRKILPGLPLEAHTKLGYILKNDN